jgi:prepilin-type N-terminal cleavage/methylation domain-containing protein
MRDIMSRPKARVRDHPGSSERGFSIIEVMVAMALISVGILGTVGVLSRVDQTRSTSYRQVAAVDLAASEMAAMKSVPYAQLGFATAVTGLQASFEARPTVMVSSSPLRPTGPDVPDRDVVFTVTRHVTWEPLATPRTPQGFKHLTVVIGWSDSLGPHTIRLDGARYTLAPGPS